MLALDAQLLILPDEEVIGLGEILPVRGEKLRGRLIKEVTIPNNTKLAYQYVARSPADLPIVCVVVAQWPSGRTRVAVGGGGESVRLAMDGDESDDAVAAVESSLSTLQDEWASAEYRIEVGGVLVRRCLEAMKDT
jgi:CO/xanthine dehydrogenase FAD-binding subunit